MPDAIESHSQTMPSSQVASSSSPEMTDSKKEHTKNWALVLKENRGIIWQLLKRYSISYVDMDDISQEALLRALKAEKHTSILNPKQFLIGIIKNVAREEITRRAKFAHATLEESDLENHPSAEPAIDEALASRETLGIFCEAVAALPPQASKVFILKHVYGASHREIAEKLGISVSTVEKHVALGLQRCRAFVLEKTGEMNEKEFGFTRVSNHTEDRK